MEMGGNAIEWGHRRNADLVLRITYRIDPEAVTLIIRDQGPGFNPSRIPHAASDEDPIAHLDVRNELGIREGGFGIMLAKGLVDEFHYNEAGNEVTLVKRFKTQGGVGRSGENPVHRDPPSPARPARHRPPTLRHVVASIGPRAVTCTDPRSTPTCQTAARRSRRSRNLAWSAMLIGDRDVPGRDRNGPRCDDAPLGLRRSPGHSTPCPIAPSEQLQTAVTTSGTTSPSRIVHPTHVAELVGIGEVGTVPGYQRSRTCGTNQGQVEGIAAGIGGHELLTDVCPHDLGDRRLDRQQGQVADESEPFLAPLGEAQPTVHPARRGWSPSRSVRMLRPTIGGQCQPTSGAVDMVGEDRPTDCGWLQGSARLGEHRWTIVSPINSGLAGVVGPVHLQCLCRAEQVLDEFLAVSPGS